MRVYYYGKFIADTNQNEEIEGKTTKPLKDNFEQKPNFVEVTAKPALKVRYYNA